MKKVLVIVLLCAVLFAAVSVASAQTEVQADSKTEVQADPKSKAEYYYAINGLLTKLQEAILKGDSDEVAKLLKELREMIYKCATFLTSIGEYDARIMEVLSLAEGAAEEGKTKEEVTTQIEKADKLAWEILMATKPAGDYTVPYSQHS